MNGFNGTQWLNCQIARNSKYDKFINFTSIKVFSPMIYYIDGWYTRPPNLISQDVLFRIAVSMMFKYVSDKNEALFLHQEMIAKYNTLKKAVYEKNLSELPF